MMIFAVGLRHLVRRARPESDWLDMLTFASAAVWLAVTLVADGLMGGGVLATLQGASGFYNAGGWGPAVIANFPPLIWFLVVGIVLIRQGTPDRPLPEAAGL